MADGTVLPVGGGGDTIWTEDVGNPKGKIPRSKIALGALDTDGGDWTGAVTANIGTTGGLALDATVAGLVVAQGSTTSGQKGLVIQGAVTTAAPAYTNGQTSPLSLTPAGALRVDGSAVTQPVSIAGNQAVNVAQVGGSAFALGQQVAGASLPVVLTAAQLTTLTPLSTVTANQGGAPWSVTQSSGPWTANITQVGGASVSLGQAAMANSVPVAIANNQGNVPVLPQAGTTGGTTPYSFISTGAVQAANIKGSAGKVYGVQMFNNNANPVWVRLYNNTNSPPGTGDTPALRYMVPGGTGGAGFVVPIPSEGVNFGTGIGIRVTAAAADNDATALASNQVVGNVLYA